MSDFTACILEKVPSGEGVAALRLVTSVVRKGSLGK